MPRELEKDLRVKNSVKTRARFLPMDRKKKIDTTLLDVWVVFPDLVPILTLITYVKFSLLVVLCGSSFFVPNCPKRSLPPYVLIVTFFFQNSSDRGVYSADLCEVSPHAPLLDLIRFYILKTDAEIHA